VMSVRETLQVEGVLTPRSRRVSFTFRRVLPSRVCCCGFPSACDSTAERRRAFREDLARLEEEVGALWRCAGVMLVLLLHSS
jgi:hypothetical protein